MVGTSLSLTSSVVESMSGKNWTFNAFSDKLPFVGSTVFTFLDSLISKSSSKESARSVIFPLIDRSASSASDDTSWESLGGE